MQVRWIKWVSLVFLCLGTLACSKGTPAGTPSSSATPSQDDDAFVARMQADHDKMAPALPWLADESHVLWKGDRITLVSHFKLLQEAGAKEIQVNYDEHEGHQIAAVFVVTLPAQGRNKVFQLQNDFWKAQAGPDDGEALAELLAKDHGQKYLVYNLDQ